MPSPGCVRPVLGHHYVRGVRQNRRPTVVGELTPNLPGPPIRAEVDPLERGQAMSFGVIRQFKGGTKDQYEASRSTVHPADGSLPPWQVLHAAGPSGDGWTIVAIHDSKEFWEPSATRP